MAKITLKRDQVQNLLDFCKKNNLKQFFFAKDQGAYIGASMGQGNNCIFYFPGCDPKKDENWYEKASRDFGGDDCGDHIPVMNLETFINSKSQELIINVTKTRITMSY